MALSVQHKTKAGCCAKETRKRAVGGTAQNHTMQWGGKTARTCAYFPVLAKLSND